jgi:hypothetical protein
MFRQISDLSGQRSREVRSWSSAAAPDSFATLTDSFANPNLSVDQILLDGDALLI